MTKRLEEIIEKVDQYLKDTYKGLIVLHKDKNLRGFLRKCDFCIQITEDGDYYLYYDNEGFYYSEDDDYDIYRQKNNELIREGGYRLLDDFPDVTAQKIEEIFYDDIMGSNVVKKALDYFTGSSKKKKNPTNKQVKQVLNELGLDPGVERFKRIDYD